MDNASGSIDRMLEQVAELFADGQLDAVEALLATIIANGDDMQQQMGRLYQEQLLLLRAEEGAMDMVDDGATPAYDEPDYGGALPHDEPIIAADAGSAGSAFVPDTDGDESVLLLDDEVTERPADDDRPSGDEVVPVVMAQSDDLETHHERLPDEMLSPPKVGIAATQDEQSDIHRSADDDAATVTTTLQHGADPDQQAVPDDAVALQPDVAAPVQLEQPKKRTLAEIVLDRAAELIGVDHDKAKRLLDNVVKAGNAAQQEKALIYLTEIARREYTAAQQGQAADASLAEADLNTDEEAVTPHAGTTAEERLHHREEGAPFTAATKPQRPVSAAAATVSPDSLDSGAVSDDGIMAHRDDSAAPPIWGASSAGADQRKDDTATADRAVSSPTAATAQQTAASASAEAPHIGAVDAISDDPIALYRDDRAEQSLLSDTPPLGTDQTTHKTSVADWAVSSPTSAAKPQSSSSAGAAGAAETPDMGASSDDGAASSILGGALPFTTGRTDDKTWIPHFSDDSTRDEAITAGQLDGLRPPSEVLQANYGSHPVPDQLEEERGVNVQHRQGFFAGELALMIGFADGSELIDMPQTYRVPNAPEWLVGLTNIHSVIIPVFDLVRFFGLSDTGDSKKMLLILGHGDAGIGIVISGLPQRLQWQASQVVGDNTAPARLRRCIRTACLIDEQLWFELDCAALSADLKAAMRVS